MLDILGLILPLFGLILLGYAGARLSSQPIEAMGWLHTFILYFALPALFFKLLANTPIEQLASWSFIGTNIAITFAVFALTFACGMFASGRKIADATVQGLAGAYGNIGYMGPAIAILAFYLAQAAAPCALFAMGVTLALRPLRRVPVALGYIVPIKLVVHPTLMYFGLSYFGNFDALWVFVAVLLAALPTATNVFVIAQQYDVWVERASASVLVTTSAVEQHEGVRPQVFDHVDLAIDLARAS